MKAQEKTAAYLTKQANRLFRNFRSLIRRPICTLMFPDPVQGEWNILRINQVITNLIANALHHGRPGGPVVVRIFTEGKAVSFSVHNKDNPIPEHMREMIFYPSIR